MERPPAAREVIGPQALPEHFPTVVMSLALGEELKRQGKCLDVDFAALNEGLTAQRLPTDQLEAVTVSYAPRQSAFQGRRSGGL
jgi:hypothetical protein